MRHTSTAKYNVVIAGVQLILQEAGKKLDSIRKQSKGKNFAVAEREIRMQLRLVKEAVKLAERELDKHVYPYDYLPSERESQPALSPVDVPFMEQTEEDGE